MSTDKENQKNQSEQAGKNKDISNSLENDAVGKKGSLNQTPQGRTDQEQNSEQKKQK
ncbi:hypothetical protein GCM10027443_39860 [Pontibacter brevis]